jgi:Fe-S-cluster containining protein
MSDVPAFSLDPDILYNCTTCGACCSNPWKIQADKQMVDDVRRLDLTTIKPSLAGFSPFYPAKQADGSTDYFIQHLNGQCGLVNSKKLCGLHTNWDYNLKPKACRMFPFRILQLGDSLYASASFVCPSIRDHVGDSLETHISELDNVLELSKDNMVRKPEVTLSPNVTLTPDDYLKVETVLLDILKTKSEPFPNRMIACVIALEMLNTLIRVTAIKSDTPTDECIAEFVKNMRDTKFERVFKIANKDGSSRIKLHVLLGMLFGFRATFTKKRSRFKTFFILSANIITHLFRIGTIRLRPGDDKIVYSDMMIVKIPDNDPDIEALLTRYFCHLVARKDLLLHSDLITGIKTFCIFYALFRWYARGLTLGRHADVATADDAAEAVSCVEKDFVFHSDFFKVMSEYSALHRAITRFMKKRDFPFVMMLS